MPPPEIQTPAPQELLAGNDRRHMVEALRPLLTAPELKGLQQAVLQVHAAPPLLNYVLDLMAATRSGSMSALNRNDSAFSESATLTPCCSTGKGTW